MAPPLVHGETGISSDERGSYNDTSTLSEVATLTQLESFHRRSTYLITGVIVNTLGCTVTIMLFLMLFGIASRRVRTSAITVLTGAAISCATLGASCAIARVWLRLDLEHTPSELLLKQLGAVIYSALGLACVLTDATMIPRILLWFSNEDPVARRTGLALIVLPVLLKIVRAAFIAFGAHLVYHFEDCDPIFFKLEPYSFLLAFLDEGYATILLCYKLVGVGWKMHRKGKNEHLDNMVEVVRRTVFLSIAAFAIPSILTVTSFVLHMSDRLNMRWRMWLVAAHMYTLIIGASFACLWPAIKSDRIKTIRNGLPMSRKLIFQFDADLDRDLHYGVSLDNALPRPHSSFDAVKSVSDATSHFRRGSEAGHGSKPTYLGIPLLNRTQSPQVLHTDLTELPHEAGALGRRRSILTVDSNKGQPRPARPTSLNCAILPRPAALRFEIQRQSPVVNEHRLPNNDPHRQEKPIPSVAYGEGHQLANERPASASSSSVHSCSHGNRLQTTASPTNKVQAPVEVTPSDSSPARKIKTASVDILEILHENERKAAEGKAASAPLMKLSELQAQAQLLRHQQQSWSQGYAYPQDNENHSSDRSPGAIDEPPFSNLPTDTLRSLEPEDQASVRSSVAGVSTTGSIGRESERSHIDRGFHAVRGPRSLAVGLNHFRRCNRSTSRPRTYTSSQPSVGEASLDGMTIETETQVFVS